jgi:hypothetical protein
VESVQSIATFQIVLNGGKRIVGKFEKAPTDKMNEKQGRRNSYLGTW